MVEEVRPVEEVRTVEDTGNRDSERNHPFG
jgi:hypothetical protein